MRISLDDKVLRPNPLRDSKLDPVDDAVVDKLATSITDFDYWGGVVGRKTPIKGVYDMIAGEHRRRAARKTGMTHADVFIGDYDDLTALRMYATENSTQRGNTSSAVLGTIGSAIRMILREELKTSGAGTRRSQGSGMQDRHGIGRPAILALLKGVPGITDNVIKEQLANLKMSGEYDRIVSEVLDEAEAVQVEAEAEAARQEAAAKAHAAAEEQRRVAAEERARVAAERTAKARIEAEAAAKRRHEANEQQARERAAQEATKAQERAEQEAARQKEEDARQKEQETAAAKAREAAIAAATNVVTIAANKPKLVARRAKAEAEKRPVEFDMRVATVFKDPRHVQTFRTLVTEDVKIRRMLPYRLQLPLATALVEQQRQALEKFIAGGGNKRHASQHELTSTYIENHLYDLAVAGSMIEHYASAAEKREAEEALRRAGWNKRFENYEEQIAGHTRSLSKATSTLVALMREVPQEHGINSLKIRRAIPLLHTVLTDLEKFGFHKRAVDGDSFTVIDHDPKLLNGEVLPPLQ